MWNIGCTEGKAGNLDRALWRHYILAVKIGYDINSLTVIRECSRNGEKTKDNYAEALRAYQTHLIR